MSRPLSDPHRRSDGERAERIHAPFAVLAEGHWPGLSLLVCREDIRQTTLWGIAQPRHTLIVHLGGAMRALETEIDGVGRHRTPPAPGDIWLVPAGLRYRSQAQGQIITYAELRIEPDAAVPGAADQERPIGALAARLGHRDAFVHHAVARLAQLLEQPDDLAGLMRDALRHLLLQALLRDYREDVPARATPSPPHALSPAEAARLAEFIEAGLADRLTLATLARVVGLSVNRLLIAFRTSFGTTPARYVLQQRLARVRHLLLHGDADIAGIALATGFSSHSHLSATFRRESGMTPRQFREGQRTLVLPPRHVPRYG